MKTQIALYSLTTLLFAAHLWRGSHPVLAILILGVPFLLFIKKPFIIYALQGLAYLISILWVFSAYELIVMRIAEGQDWMRLLIILFIVALYSAASGVFLTLGKVPEIYALNSVSKTPDD